jgi:uncharacterized OsmC-like protein
MRPLHLAMFFTLFTSRAHAQGSPMTLIAPSLGQRFTELRQRLASADKADVVTNTAEVRLIRDQHSEATVRGFTLTQDEPASAWGTSQGPTPTDYFVASIGFCQNVLFARNASMAGLSIDSLQTTVTGSWDRRGLFALDSATPAFTTVTIETHVASPSPVEEIADVARRTERTCPVHATLARATALTFRLVVNGRPVPLER